MNAQHKSILHYPLINMFRTLNFTVSKNYLLYEYAVQQYDKSIAFRI